MKTIEEIIDKHWDAMFEEIIHGAGEEMDELLIEVQIDTEGKTYRRSWRDRNERLRE